ncbi:MAG: sigma-70 family RNA polymerase sigma factor [Fimbriimonadaceae bacterium]|nr:sigma-70 family RNA polymerase sigma factor [Fimbriimonadaceae bacterium]MCC7102277.1 sigma-70 family RNA polymerase sigma factor [Fimbriimonadaceae bacterium]
MFNLSLSSNIASRGIEDARFLERCRHGDEEALTVLIDRHRARLIRVAANILRDSNEAEDVAQEAFLKAFRELHSLREDRAFSGYIYRICVRLCMDRLRQRKAEPAEFDSVIEHEGSHIDNKIVIHKLLGQLSEDLRNTLILREMEQLSYEEIADVMRVPVGTVRSRLHVARERFRDLWMAATRDS